MVEKAEMHSKSASERLRSLVATMTRVARTTRLIALTATTNAWRSVTSGTARSKATTSRSPRTSAQTIRNSTAKVVTLMPPAGDALPPPTNISMSVTNSESVPMSA